MSFYEDKFYLALEFVPFFFFFFKTCNILCSNTICIVIKIFHIVLRPVLKRFITIYRDADKLLKKIILKSFTSGKLDKMIAVNTGN